MSDILGGTIAIKAIQEQAEAQRVQALATITAQTNLSITDPKDRNKAKDIYKKLASTQKEITDPKTEPPAGQTINTQGTDKPFNNWGYK